MFSLGGWAFNNSTVNYTFPIVFDSFPQMGDHLTRFMVIIRIDGGATHYDRMDQRKLPKKRYTFSRLEALAPPPVIMMTITFIKSFPFSKNF